MITKIIDINNKDIDDIIATLIYKDNFKVMEMEKDKEFMEDYIHTCLKCGELSFEIADNVYKCYTCGFEWEVISFE